MMHVATSLTCHKSCSKPNKAQMKLPVTSSLNLETAILPTIRDVVGFFQVQQLFGRPRKIDYPHHLFLIIKRTRTSWHSQAEISPLVIFMPFVMNLKFPKSVNNANHLSDKPVPNKSLIIFGSRDYKKNDEQFGDEASYFCCNANLGNMRR